MTKIVIAGAGFAGLNVALKLDRVFGATPEISITLLDKHDYHLFSPELYEVATADEEMTTVDQLRRSVILPIKNLLAGTRVQFVQGEIGAIDNHRKTIKVGVRDVAFDYLILALGSQTEYFNIEGAQKYSLPLKTLNDAFRIRNALEFAVESHQQDSVKQYVRFVLAGGGYTGVEFAAELSKLADILAWKNNYPREKIEICIIEAANQLVPGFSDRASRDIYQRLKDLGVGVKLLAPIFKVEQNIVTLLSGEKYEFDVLVWATGVRGAKCELGQDCQCNKHGQFETDEFLRVQGQDHIFALGDIACVQGKKQAPIPATSQSAIAEARYLAYALPILMKNQKPRPFTLGSHPFIVSVGGKWAIFKSRQFYFTGYLPYLLRLGANIRYFARLIGWWKAFKYVWFEAEMYSRND